jgi:hypothetical protein
VCSRRTRHPPPGLSFRSCPRPIIEDATGGRLAAPVWGRVAQRFYQKRKAPEPWRAPEGVVARQVDPRSGLILKKGCAPRSGQPQRELFLEEMQPAAWCPGREAPPRNGFPVMRLMEEQRRREREQARLAAARRAEEESRLRAAAAEREARERAERERQARLTEAERKKEAELAAAREKKEAERLARERKEREAKEAEATLARQREREKEQERLAAKKKEAERLARIEEEERRLDEREAEIAREEKRRRAKEDREQRARDEEARRPVREEEAAEEEADEEAEEEAVAASDLSGWWEMTNRIEETNYSQYKGLRLGYRVQLEQEGNRITGRGQKWTEEGRTIPASGRTPITVNGKIEGRKVILSFTEHGAKRATNGGFTWTLAADRSELRGSFWSTAAKTRGRSTAVRMP